MALAVVDANLLLYAFNPADALHKDALRWLEATLSGDDVLAIPMLTVAALLRASTHPSLDRLPQRMKEAVRFIDELLALPNVRLLHTDGSHWPGLKRMLAEGGVLGRTVTDAEFAALTLLHSGTLYTTDRHFRHFPSLRWTNPLRDKR